MPQPNISNEPTVAPEKQAAQSLTSSVQTTRDRTATGLKQTVMDPGATASFREYRVVLDRAKSSFEQSPLARNVNTIFSAVSKATNGVPFVAKDGSLAYGSIDDYRRQWDMKGPKNMGDAIRAKITSGAFKAFGDFGDLNTATALPALVGFRDVATSLAPAQVESHMKRRETLDYQGLNLASPFGDPKGRLIVEPIVFEAPEGRREIYGFHNPSTRQYMTVCPSGNQVDLYQRIAFAAGKENGRPSILRMPMEGSIYKSFAFDDPDHDAPAMIAEMEQVGFRPLYVIPGMRADLPEGGPREKGSMTMAFEGVMRTARAAQSGAITAGLSAFQGDFGPMERLREMNPIDGEMARSWETLALSMKASNLTDKAVVASIKYVEAPLLALAKLDTTFKEAISQNGAHRDPVFAIQNYLVDRFGIGEKTTHVGSKSVPVETLRNLLYDRSPEQATLDAKSDEFGAAAKDPNVARLLRLETIHEELSRLLPEIIKTGPQGPVQSVMTVQKMAPVLDGAGKPKLGEDKKPVMAMQMVKVPATWTASGAPRYSTDLDPILTESSRVLQPVNDASQELDAAVRSAKANLSAVQARFVSSIQPSKLGAEATNRYIDLVIKECSGETISDADRQWKTGMEKGLRESAPAFSNLIATYVDGAYAAAEEMKIGSKELERNGFAVGRVLQGMKQTPLNAYPIGTYSMPPLPSRWVVLVPDSKECTRFSAYTPKRKVDGDYLGSMELSPVAKDMNLNEAAEFMRKESMNKARVGYTATPRCEFFAPRDEATGFPMLKPGQEQVRVRSEQEQLAHAMRWPIISASDPHDHGANHKFAFVALQVDQQRGVGAAAFKPGNYVPIFTLQKDSPNSRANILPRTFSGLPPQFDEITFAKENPSKDQVIDTLKKAMPEMDSQEISRQIRSLYARGGRYSYPNLTFEEGTKAYYSTRTTTIDLMEKFNTIKATVTAQAKIPTGMSPQSAVAQKVQATLSTELTQITAQAEAQRAGAGFVFEQALRRADRFQGQQVKDFIALRGDGAGTHEQNFMLAWPSVGEMMQGPDSLPALQKRGLLPGRFVMSRIDE